ncbi:hypothetical protein CWB85_18760 [Pseudoalteromonas sp. S1727]|uniref:hypothetical protein n=1 Tax=Pseudoalteromonas sp. S1727 TaxID=2066514 RepID=UPI001109FA0E|nr:hypothetical protein [Pseudoalteromonas sp. S1727]TMN68094.1 hypothetical protein CWB85_18760 [Pseudoalteromonas sp. S1727]
MGIFSKFKDNYEKNLVIEILNDQFKRIESLGLLSFNPKKLSVELVENLWGESASYLNGSIHKRPARIVFSIAALSNGLECLAKDDVQNQKAFLVLLRELFTEVDVNRNQYGIKAVDVELLEIASKIYVEFSQNLSSEESVSEQVNLESYQTWDEWYAVFQVEAALHFDKLGKFNCLEYMDKSPLQRAYEDNVDPKSLAKVFAENTNFETVFKNSV